MKSSGSIKVRTPPAWHREAMLRTLKAAGAHRLADVEPGPVPPDHIIESTAVMLDPVSEIPQHRENFLISGYFHVREMVDHATRAGLDFNAVTSVFELGCGAARIIRHLRVVPNVRLVASDISAESIAWCKENISGVEFHPNQRTPPLAFAQDSSFDLALAMSVFTHIPLKWQTLWAKEFARVLRPSGFMIATVAGEYHRKLQLRGENENRFRQHGHVELSPEDPGVSFSSIATNTCDTFQTKSRVEEMFGEIFEIVRYVDNPQSLDMLVLRGPA